MEQDLDLAFAYSKPLDLDEYEKAPLGQGVFGTVYSIKKKTCHMSEPQNICAGCIYCVAAVKHSRNSPDLDEEAAIHKTLRHPNIVRFYAFSNNGLYMEPCLQGSLDKFVDGMSFAKASKYMRKVMSAVMYLLDNNIAHMDLKPSNILLSNDCPKISDFGGAKRLVNGWCKLDQYTKQAAPPEVMRYVYSSGSNVLDGKSVDIWSAGITFICLLIGKYPWAFARSSCVEYKEWENENENSSLGKVLSKKSPYGLHVISSMLTQYYCNRPSAIDVLSMLLK